VSFTVEMLAANDDRDVYLRHAGRSFRAADEAGGKEIA
jgi:hypothetical protein